MRSYHAGGLAAIAACLLGLLAIDWLTTWGPAAGVLYAVVIWATHLVSRPLTRPRLLPVYLAIICSAFIIIGALVAPIENQLRADISRTLALAIVWLVAFAAIRVRQTEQRWRIAESRTHAILESALDAFIAIDASGRVTMWNRQAEDLFGWPREEALGQRLEELIIPPEVRPVFAAAYERYRNTGRPQVLGQRLELNAQRRDGTCFPAELTVSASWRGDEVSFSAFVRDITQWRNEEQQQQRAMVEAQVLEQITHALATATDFEDSLEGCLDVLCRHAGWAAGHVLLPNGAPLEPQLVSTDIWFLKDEKRYGVLREASQNRHLVAGQELPGRVYAAKQPMWVDNIQDELSFPREHDAGPLPVRSALAFPFMIDTEVAAVLEFFGDDGDAEPPLMRQEDFLPLAQQVSNRISEVIQHRRWEEQRARLAAIVDSSGDAIIGWTAEGRITNWNRGAELMYGYGVEEVIGETIDVILPTHPDIEDERRDLLELFRTGKRLEQYESRRRRKDGRIVTVSITVSPIVDSDGRMIGMATIERDITERNLAEAELRHAKDAAERANHARSEFLANVSHELRTPISAVLGMTELALDEPLSDVARDYIVTAQASARSLQQLLNDILDFSRLESGKFTIEHEPFRLRDLLDDTVRTLSNSAFERGLEVACEIDKEIPNGLVGDAVRLRQVLTNLIGNAIKFTDSGEIVVAVELVRRWPAEIRLRFSVRDTGVGISLEDQRRIFEPFTQGDASPTRRHGGTGLGLAICSELLHLMGGRLALRSEPGKGSDFSFVLSFPLVPQELDGDHLAPSEKLRGLRVLLVDDHQTSRRILSETLRNWAMEPTVTGTASDALRLVEEADRAHKAFSVVVVDATLPDAEGNALPEQINAALPGRSPAVIMMFCPTDRRAMRYDGQLPRIAGAVLKPVSQSDLLEAIQRALNIESPCLQCVTPAADPPPSPAPLFVLLAEDTPANQKMVTSILRKRGHGVAIANDGHEAVEMFKSNHFDVILMDVQMPMLDGYQATAAIRRLERQRQQAPTPIVALTAHAMRGDREKCLEAGMDAYLAKPIEIRELLSIVESLAIDPRRSAITAESRKTVEPIRAAASPKTATAPPRPIDRSAAAHDQLNVEAALQRLGSDESLYREFVGLFDEDAPPLLERLLAAQKERDVDNLQRAAHSLKGLLASIGADQASHIAQEIMKLTRNTESAPMDVTEELVRQLQGLMERIDDQLQQFRTTQ